MILAIIANHQGCTSDEIRQELWVAHRQDVSMTYLRTLLRKLRNSGEISKRRFKVGGVHGFKYYDKV